MALTGNGCYKNIKLFFVPFFIIEMMIRLLHFFFVRLSFVLLSFEIGECVNKKFSILRQSLLLQSICFSSHWRHPRLISHLETHVWLFIYQIINLLICWWKRSYRNCGTWSLSSMLNDWTSSAERLVIAASRNDCPLLLPFRDKSSYYFWNGSTGKNYNHFSSRKNLCHFPNVLSHFDFNWASNRWEFRLTWTMAECRSAAPPMESEFRYRLPSFNSLQLNYPNCLLSSHPSCIRMSGNP